MKKLFVVVLAMILSLALFGFAGAQEGEGGAIIDLGESEIFSQEDLQSAVDAILAEFSTWEGTEMHLVTYAGDVQSLSELEYVQKNYEEGYDEVAVFSMNVPFSLSGSFLRRKPTAPGNRTCSIPGASSSAVPKKVTGRSSHTAIDLQQSDEEKKVPSSGTFSFVRSIRPDRPDLPEKIG